MMRLILGAPRRRIDEGVDADIIGEISDESGDVSSQTSDLDFLDQIAQAQEEETVEPWPDWVKRTTHQVEDLLKKLGLEDWLTLWRRRHWRWARTVVTKHRHKWTSKALAWNPPSHSRRGGLRKQARPKKRWLNEIKTFCKDHATHSATSWETLAQDSEEWQRLENEFVQKFQI